MVHVLGVRSLDWPGELRVHEAAFLPVDFPLGHQTAVAISLGHFSAPEGAGQEEDPLVFSAWGQRRYSKCFMTSASGLCNWASVLGAPGLVMTDLILYFLGLGPPTKS